MAGRKQPWGTTCRRWGMCWFPCSCSMARLAVVIFVTAGASSLWGCATPNKYDPDSGSAPSVVDGTDGPGAHDGIAGDRGETDSDPHGEVVQREAAASDDVPVETSVPDAACNPNTGCCNDTDCGACQKCVNGTCTPTPSSQQSPGCSGPCQSCDGAGKCISGTQLTCWRDQDQDSFGDRRSAMTTCSPVCPAGMVLNSDDCVDTNSDAHPATPERPVVFQDTHRGDGSFDWDCNGTLEANPATITQCERRMDMCERIATPTPTTLCGMVVTSQRMDCGCRGQGAFCSGDTCGGAFTGIVRCK
jgi:hypothetical protein